MGAKLLYPNGNVQHGGVILGIGGVAGRAAPATLPSRPPDTFTAWW